MEGITNIILNQIKEIEQKDEAQIIADMAGEVLQDYVYEFTRFDRRIRREVRIVKLSWVGVREVARGRGNIMLEEPNITETSDHWRIVLRATDLTRNFSVFGGCHQPKRMTVQKVDEKTGEVTSHEIIDDPHAFAKCLSKAQRNALEPCIPGDFALRMIDRFLVAANKKPLRLAGSRVQLKTPGKINPQPKPKAEWDKITKEQVPNLTSLEKIFWNLTKKQPAEMYHELGVTTKNECTMLPWEAFLQLKEVFGETKEESNEDRDKSSVS